MLKVFLKKFFLILSYLVIFLFVKVEVNLAMELTSPEFKNNQSIPAKFTCQGLGVNPALVITGIPSATKSLVLFIEDPDAVSGTFLHWMVYDIPVVGRIEENSVPGKQGSNDGGRFGYVSPCPPTGAHRYFFKIYALDKILNLAEGISKPALEKAMLDHILGQAELVGLYKKR